LLTPQEEFVRDKSYTVRGIYFGVSQNSEVVERLFEQWFSLQPLKLQYSSESIKFVSSHTDSPTPTPRRHKTKQASFKAQEQPLT
jgi:hypothetical protein